MVFRAASAMRGVMPSGRMLNSTPGMPTMQQRAQMGGMSNVVAAMAPRNQATDGSGAPGTANHNGGQSATTQSPRRPLGVS
jgi:hypothetical protein